MLFKKLILSILFLCSVNITASNTQGVVDNEPFVVNLNRSINISMILRETKGFPRSYSTYRTVQRTYYKEIDGDKTLYSLECESESLLLGFKIRPSRLKVTSMIITEEYITKRGCDFTSRGCAFVKGGKIKERKEYFKNYSSLNQCQSEISSFKKAPKDFPLELSFSRNGDLDLFFY